MQKTKTVRAHKRKTKSGKTVTVKQHTAKYDAAEAARKAFLKDSRAGSEYASIKDMPTHGISADDFKEWYHWDLDDDPNNEAALRVKEALVKKLGKKGYQDYEDKMTDSYTRRGHLSAFKKLEGMLKPKPNATYEHTTKLPRKHSAERPLSDRGAKNLEGIQGKGLKMPKGFKYNDEQHSDDYDSFVATDKRAINALKKQIAGKRWKKVEAEDGSVHFHSPDKSVHVVVNDQRAAIFYRENPVTAKTSPKPITEKRFSTNVGGRKYYAHQDNGKVIVENAAGKTIVSKGIVKKVEDAFYKKMSEGSKDGAKSISLSGGSPKKTKVDDLDANHAKEVASAKTVQDKWKLLDKWYRRKEIGVHPSDMQKLRASAKTGFSQKEKQVINKLFKTFSV